MIPFKNPAFTKINKRYFNKKIYLDGNKFKMNVFSSLIIIHDNTLRFGFFLGLNNI
jgi:hypothetical protein